MFNKDYYTEEDAIFANVEADLSYDGADGLCRAIIESYENERLVEAYMDKADAAEAQMLAESASQEDIESLQEASVKSVIQIIIGIMQRFYAKVKGMIARFIHKIQLWFAKRTEKRLHSDKKKMDKIIAGKTKAGFNITASRNANGNANNDITVLADNKQNQIQSKMNLANCNPYFYLTTYFVEDKDKYEYKSHQTQGVNSDDKEDIYDQIVNEAFGTPNGTLSYSDLRSDLKDYFYEEDKEVTSSQEVIDFLFKNDSAKKAIKWLKKTDNEFKKYCNNVAKLGKSAKMKDNAQYIKGLNRLVNILNTVLLRILNVSFSLTMEQLNSYFRAYNKLALDSVSISVK